MTCDCGGSTFVRDSRAIHANAGHYTRRRRQCGYCGTRFTTHEIVGIEARVVSVLGRPRNVSRGTVLRG